MKNSIKLSQSNATDFWSYPVRIEIETLNIV